MTQPIVIWGAGAIGGTLAAYWMRAGVDVLLVDIAADHVAACAGEGLAIEGPVDEFHVRVPAVTPDRLDGVYDRIVLAVKAHHTVAAARALAPHLSADGFVLSAQNGLNEIALSEILGAPRVMGAFVNFGADWHGPGHIMFGNRGAVVVGEIEGPVQNRTRSMFELLQRFEPDAVLTDNIWGYLWGKLAYGAMLFGTALTDESIADNFADPGRFPAWHALGREVMATAAARGVNPVGFNGFDPAGFAPGRNEAAARATIAELADFNRPSKKTHSGIWRDLAVRKRRTEVDAQIAIIADLADQAGVATPAIRRLVELIHDVEDGRRERSPATLDALIAECR